MRDRGEGAGAGCWGREGGRVLGVWGDGMGLGRVGCRIHIKSH